MAMSTSEAGQRGGSNQGKQNNPGNFDRDRKKASRAGKIGAEHQPVEAKRRGGEHSHQNR
ncbi:MAG TPA: hypothetical protein VLF60_01920 [Candidatus Saccharimonadales bacterium]|nr:hypothetical protein [Candidatus Saccharimonadales bacterium]